jgi:hypothetical protein
MAGQAIKRIRGKAQRGHKIEERVGRVLHCGRVVRGSPSRP